ncbi:MAG: hypothetical protein CME64_01695 [Halobacteriovoraceae bacterium]|nr:hypothetical protein [Halobacteriovoraceae bacterium]|tara:strand:+ start:86243 stop:87178 length:936 start_codon:yes stop_codon:yes gene_type:complete
MKVCLSKLLAIVFEQIYKSQTLRVRDSVMNYLEPDPIEIKKNYGAVFHRTVQFLKEHDDQDLNMVYAFYSYTKKLASQKDKKQALKDLKTLEAELENPSNTFMVRFLETLKRLEMGTSCAKEIIEASKYEIQKKRPLNHNQLMVYCYKNNAAFIMMLATSLGAKDPRALACAMDLGLSINLTTICSRALKDLNEGRVLFPEDELVRNGVKDLKPGQTPNGLKRIVKKYLALADTYYAHAYEGLRFLQPRARIGVLVTMNQYRELARKIERKNYEVLDSHIRLTSMEKTKVTLKSLIEFMRPSLHLKEAFVE